jgi:hypothetical protein
MFILRSAYTGKQTESEKRKQAMVDSDIKWDVQPASRLVLPTRSTLVMQMIKQFDHKTRIENPNVPVLCT